MRKSTKIVSLMFVLAALTTFMTALVAQDNGNNTPAPAPAPPVSPSAPEQPKADEAKPDLAIVTLFDKFTKAVNAYDAAAIVDLFSKKALKEFAENIREKMENAEQKAALEKKGITADDMKLDDKALALKYVAVIMDILKKHNLLRGENKKEYNLEVIETKIDGNKAVAKVKSVLPNGNMDAREQNLAKEDGVWKFDDKDSFKL